MIPSNYRVIMMVTTWFDPRVRICVWLERNGCPSAGHASLQKGFTTLDHMLTVQALIEERRARKRRIYCFFVDFWKAFDN